MIQVSFSKLDTLAWLSLGLLIICSGCIPLDEIGGGSLSGTVQGQSFSVRSGTADADSQGNYVITLSDTSAYTCTSSPSGSYLTIVVAHVQGTGTFSATSSVSFNVVDDNVNTSEAAFSGTVTIDTIDVEDRGIISGRLSASNSESEVSGSFTVDICD